MIPAKILLIEGKGAADSLQQPLSSRGHRVVVAHTGRSGLRRIATSPPDVIIVDGTSLTNGPQICQMMPPTIPIILIVAGEPPECDAADVCLVKPFTLQKLLTRIEWLMPLHWCNVLRAGDLALDLDHHRVFRNGRKVHLTLKQARLLETFMRHPGEILNRSFLIRHVWQTDYLDDTRTLDTHISWLRRAIEPNPAEPRYIRTVPGIGYRFEASPQ